MPLDSGTERHFHADLTAAALAARNAIAASPLEVREFTAIGDSAWSMIAKPAHGGTEIVRVVCERMSPDEVAVRIVTRRRDFLAGTLHSDWSEPLFAQIELELER